MKSTIIFLSLLGLNNLVWVYAAESSLAFCPRLYETTRFVDS